MGMLAEGLNEGQRRELMAKDREIALLVKQLGGDDRAYRRERGRALRATVAEIYSAPGITAAAKMLPSLRVIPGFALDLTTEDGRGQP